MSAEEYAVVARGVDHWFGEGELRKQVLFENDLRISPGEIVIMTGPSGSGKTTLLTLIGALRKLQNGSLTVRGTELAGLGDDGLMRVRRRIGFIFQAHNLFASLTATENVRLALELEPGTVAERNTRAKAMLSQLGLEDRLEHKPNQLSGGQRQRVAIARALVGRPGLILADEPTAALDEQSGRTVVGLLRNFADQERAAILIVTHDNRILDVADRIVNMTFGRIVSNIKKQESLRICEFLAQVSVFQNLTPTALAAVADNMALESFAAGTDLVRQGDEGDKFYVIRSGTAEVLVDNARVRTLEAGDSFGEIALISDQPRTATVRALEPFDAYTLGKADFRDAIEKSETFREQVLKVYFQRQ